MATFKRAPDARISTIVLLLLLPIGLLSGVTQALLIGEEARADAHTNEGRSPVGASQIVQRSFVDDINEADGGEYLQSIVIKDSSLVCTDVDVEKVCPVTCFRPDPVCGEDGVTYWCGCQDAQCAGVAVLHVGYCKIRSSAPAEKGSQALLLIHAIWLVLLGFSCLFGFL